MQSEITGLSSIQNGVVDDLFNEAWKDLIANLSDPNVQADAVREINIKIKVKPQEKLIGPAKISVEVTKKYPGIMPAAGSIIIDRDRTSGLIGTHN